MAGKRPVLFHNADRRFHTSGHQRIQQALEGVQRRVIGGDKGLAGNRFNRVGVIHKAPRFHAHGEAHDLIAHADRVIRVGDPVFPAQIHGVFRPQRIHVFRVYHRERIGIVGGVTGSHMRGNRIVGEIDFHADAGGLGILLRHFHKLGLNF